MTVQTAKKQVTREYYNVLYSAKLHLASFDICEKLPTAISFISLSFGVLGLAFAEFNSNALASLLLIIGIIGIALKPRELQKDHYKAIGTSLTDISKKLEDIYCQIDEQDVTSVAKARTDLRQIQQEHSSIVALPPVLLSSWYAHYKVFSEHNSDWMCAELNLGWKDKVPLSLRMTVIGVLVAAILWINPFCISTKSWAWFSEPCVGCWQEQPTVEQLPVPNIEASSASKPDGKTIE
ncbi:SLATT domain-containing protein [Vibrio parahaemolyticus]|uniref:SLATT domain-containing protein n=1 Tax=Vibrio parahaemolyticus TaxID=670 RepID=UPI000AC6BA1F|nr:SLATT domain-containing protein [Vibrio parahaemolyticus]